MNANEELAVRKALHKDHAGQYYASRLALAMWLPATCCVCGHEFTVDSMIEKDARLERWEGDKPILRCADGQHED